MESEGEATASPKPKGGKKPGAGRKCGPCHHKDRALIDRQIVDGRPMLRIAEEFGVSQQALLRHRDHSHLPIAAAAAEREEADGARGLDLLASAGELREKALALLAQAEAAGDLKTAMQGIRECSRVLELMGKLRGVIDESATINILVAPQLIAVQQQILIALAPFPDARAAVVAALGSIGGPAGALIEHAP